MLLAPDERIPFTTVLVKVNVRISLELDTSSVKVNFYARWDFHCELGGSDSEPFSQYTGAHTITSKKKIRGEMEEITCIHCVLF